MFDFAVVGGGSAGCALATRLFKNALTLRLFGIRRNFSVQKDALGPFFDCNG